MFPVSFSVVPKVIKDESGWLFAFNILIFASIKEYSSPFSIMTSYNLVNGEYANENTHLLQDILKKEWKYNGIIVSDWGGNNDRIKGLEAGCNVEMPTTAGDTNIDIVNAVKNGTLKEEVLNERVDEYISFVLGPTSLVK